MLPDVPTIAESVPGYDAWGWQGVGAPKGTPAAIIERLNREINDMLADPAMKARIVDLGGMTIPKSPLEAAAFISSYTEKWAKIITGAGIRME